MRIALLSHTFRAAIDGSDGVGPDVLVHARALIALGHKVEVFAAGVVGEGESGRRVEIDGVPCRFYARERALGRALVGDGNFGLSRVAASLSTAADVLGALRRELRAGAFDVVEIVADGPSASLVGLCDGLPAVLRSGIVWSPDGSAVERFGAARLARIGMASAPVVSVPSFWLRDKLLHEHLHEGPLVIPDGVELPESARHGEADGRRLFVWCEAAGDEIGAFAAMLGAVLVDHRELELLVSGREEAAGSLCRALVDSKLGVGGRVGRRELASAADFAALDPVVGVFWFDRAPVAPHALLAAMAAGMPLAVRAVGAVPEAARDEVDALLFDDPAGARARIDRLCSADGLRKRLAGSARLRAERRFDPIACARSRLAAYQLVVAGRIASNETDETDENAMSLGPDNWFDAWWLSSAEPRPTRLRRDEAGRIALLDLAYDELKLVEAVLSRTWCEGPKDWAASEWAELRELQVQMLEHADALRRGRVAAGERPAVEFALPPDRHPMFAPDQQAFLLGEAWRLEGHPGYAEWLRTAVRRRDFAVRARENVHLRRIAVEAARRIPGSAVFDVLRRIYRDRRSRDRVVGDDREFLASHPGGDSFAAGIADFGLHSPFAKDRFPTARRRRRRAEPEASPRISVVIPSYRHEEYVRLAIESCLRQTVDEVAVIVADDRSPDGTVDAARAIDDPRLEVTVNPENLGLGASVLRALDRVTTPYVALLNSDDLFHPERLARCLAVFDADPEASLVSTGFAVVDRKGVVLTHETACAAEIGPKAYRWLRWFEAIARDELRRPEDWTAFEVLLRHNVLATSSNMVFRTEWLRRHMPEASRLKYCLDWQLFLQAAMEGTLRMVEGELLAYRLHSANTVWFEEGGRADYVFEVNRVVDRVLGQWLERAVARDGPEAAVARFAELLERDVRSHGETDGLALYLADLAGRHAEGRLDPEAEPLVGLAEAALRRNAYARVTEDLDVDPWSLPWRLETADKWHLEHDVAEGYAARARALDAECGRHRLEIDSCRQEIGELRDRQHRAEAELQGVRGELEALRDAERREAEAAERLRAEIDELRRAKDAEIAERDRRLAEKREAIAERDRRLAEKREAIAERDRRLAEKREAIEDRDRRLAEKREAIAERDRRLAELRGALAEARERIARLEADVAEHLETLRGVRRDLERSREFGARHQRLYHRAAGLLHESRAEKTARLSSPSWRLGDVFARRVGLLGAYKTLAALARRGGAISCRVRLHASGLLTSAGRARAGIAVFVDRLDGARLDERPLRWLESENGEPRRLIGWSAELPRAVPRELGGIWLRDDAALAAADRRYFARRNPDGVEALSRLLGSTPWLDRAFRGARLVKTSRAGIAVAHGLRGGAVQAHVAGRLCGTDGVLVLGDEDLIDLRLERDVAAELIRAARLLVVDSDLVLREAEHLADGTPRAVVRWATPPDDRADAPPRDGPIRLFVEWSGVLRADPATLVEGVRLAVANGNDVEVDVIGRLGDGEEGLRRWLAFEDRIAEAGLEPRFHCHGRLSPSARRTVLARAHAVAWIGRSIAGGGLPRLPLEGLVAGRPALASAVDGILWVPALAAGLELVEPGEPGSFAAAIDRMRREPEVVAARLAEGRAVLARRAADERAERQRAEA